MKYADKRAAPVAVIEGGDEREAGQVTLKDLALGARLAAEIETNEEWKAQPAQTTVARADLVAEVRAHARDGRTAKARAHARHVPGQARRRRRWRPRLTTVGIALFHEKPAMRRSTCRISLLGETLLDLYGEDLRARAFLFPDAERDERAVPASGFHGAGALAHGAGGWDLQSGYTYAGPVFRRQPQGLGRPTEYVQAGIESFGAADRVEEDARIFALLHRGLADLGVTGVETQIGDLSIPFALLDALDMPDRRRAALRRHFWRPARFRALVERACVPPVSGADRLDAGLHEVLGLRTEEDVRARLAALAEEAAEPVMPRSDADLIGAVLQLDCPATEAPARLRALTSGIGTAIDRMEARLEALSAQGLDPANMVFDANFGRNLEYYDGFVFELRRAGGGDHPPLAGGGRYDALTAQLGATRQVPAIGGIIRPESVLEAAS